MSDLARRVVDGVLIALAVLCAIGTCVAALGVIFDWPPP